MPVGACTEAETIVMLHGFGGTGRSYDGVIAALGQIIEPERYTPKALDLPGHGALADRHRAISFQACVESVLARAPGRFLLCGYSMGGRIALQVALAQPDRVRGLVLVSATAGIDSEGKRERRIASDEQIAREIEEGPFSEFVARWRSQPLFADQSETVRALAAQDMMRNLPSGLAAAMRGIGAGRMEPLWGSLGALERPVMVLAGERDEKYVALGKRLAAMLPAASLRIVQGGHGLLLENPQAVAAAIAQLLDGAL